eukprot:755468-Pelagomonas_calceolata.AAC.2
MNNLHCSCAVSAFVCWNKQSLCFSVLERKQLHATGHRMLMKRVPTSRDRPPCADVRVPSDMLCSVLQCNVQCSCVLECKQPHAAGHHVICLTVSRADLVTMSCGHQIPLAGIHQEDRVPLPPLQRPALLQGEERAQPSRPQVLGERQESAVPDQDWGDLGLR